jgi:hypothetical protein
VSRTVFAFLLCLAAPAWAQGPLRTIPADAKRGEMSYLPDMSVRIDGEKLQLAPGFQIRDPMNMIIVPAALPDKTIVKYSLDSLGMVRQVWILTPEEAAASAPPNPFPR